MEYVHAPVSSFCICFLDAVCICDGGCTQYCWPVSPESKLDILELAYDCFTFPLTGSFTRQQYVPSVGYKMDGLDLELFKDTTQAWCEERCNSLAECAAYMFGNSTWSWKNVCWLKGSVTPLMIDDIGLVVYTTVGRSYTPSVGYTVMDDDLDFYPDTTQPWCQAKCDAVVGCKAFVFGAPGSGGCNNCCKLKQTVTDLTPSPGMISYISSGLQPTPSGGEWYC